MKRAVFLDRDGVVNKVILRKGEPTSPRNLEELEFTGGIEALIVDLKEKGFVVVVVTNQPDIARGILSPEMSELINERVRERLPVDDLYVCPHDDDDDCSCRKPRPGMLLKAARKWKVDLSGSYIIGDRDKDMEAGKAAGCTTIILDTPYNRGIECDYRVKSLEEVKEII